MKNRLEGEGKYEDIYGEYDVIRLLLLIKRITYSYKSKSYPVPAIYMALRKFYTIHKSISSSCNDYFETMSNLRVAISHCGDVIGNHPFLVEKFLKAADPEYPETPTENETAKSKTATEEAYMATYFLSGLSSSRYWALLNNLKNDFCMGRTEYPKTLKSAYDLAIN